MTGRDDEFDDFLRRRKPLFDRSRDDDVFEPPAELDRIVLRQARDAIEAPRPQHVYRAPRWTAPFAVAATLAAAFTVVWQLMPTHHTAAARQAAAEVSLQNASRRVDAPAEAAGSPIVADEVASDGTVVVQLEQLPAEAARDRVAAAPPPPAAKLELPPAEAEARGYVQPPPPASPVLNARAARRAEADTATTPDAPADTESAGAMPAGASVAGASPGYRRDEKTWLAEIERLRATGDVLRADAELAEFKRLHRAYASGPDR